MEENEFKKIIQKAVLDEPPTSFTDNIMQSIGMQQEVAKNDALGKLLQTAVLSSPTAEFTNNIMQQVVPQKQIAFQPIISKKAWRIISSIAAIIFAAILVIQFTAKKTPNTTSKLDGLFSLNNKIFVEMAQQFSTVFICLISVCILLMADSLLRKKINISKLA